MNVITGPEAVPDPGRIPLQRPTREAAAQDPTLQEAVPAHPHQEAAGLIPQEAVPAHPHREAADPTLQVAAVLPAHLRAVTAAAAAAEAAPGRVRIKI